MDDKLKPIREAFEAWYFDKFLVRAERYSLDPEQYAYPHTRDTWEGWQAGREAIAAPGVEQGCVMVPKVASTAMLRPFYECPPDELALAYEAMLIVARRAAPSPTAEQPERPPYCGSGHCSCIECPYAAPVTIKGGNE